jgi:hypothetical protein
LYDALQRIPVGGQLVAAVQHLNVEKAGAKYRCYGQEDGQNHVFAAFEILQNREN